MVFKRNENIFFFIHLDILLIILMMNTNDYEFTIIMRYIVKRNIIFIIFKVQIFHCTELGNFVRIKLNTTTIHYI